MKMSQMEMRPVIDKVGLSKIYRRADLSPEYREVGTELVFSTKVVPAEQ